MYPRAFTVFLSIPMLLQANFIFAKVDLQQCVALRGNGNWIGAHFGALARIVDDHKTIDALAGGSSATVTSLLYESITINPTIIAEQDPILKSQYISLMLKSVYGYMDSGQERVSQHFRALQKLRSEDFWRTLDFQNIEPNISSWLERIQLVEQKFNLTGLINPEFIGQLQNENIPVPLRIERAKTAIQTLQEFKADNLEVFFRDGLISFAGLAEFVSRFADFYAGRFATAKQLAATQKWLERCGPLTAKLSWQSIAKHRNSGISFCAQQAISTMDRYFDSYNQASTDNPQQKHRIDEQIGAYLPVLISTAVVKNQSIMSYESALAKYRNGETTIEWPVDFAKDLRFGYWGPLGNWKFLNMKQSLATAFPADLKSAMFESLGQISWRDALQASPAEPGLSRAVALPLPTSSQSETMYSVGGWSDLHPVQVLHALGCDRTIYVTRFGLEADLAIGAATLLGADPKSEIIDLYDTESERISSYESAVIMAAQKGAIWCTNWHKFGAEDILAMSEDAYHSPVYTKDEHYLRDQFRNIFDSSMLKKAIPGCTSP